MKFPKDVITNNDLSKLENLFNLTKPNDSKSLENYDLNRNSKSSENITTNPSDELLILNKGKSSTSLPLNLTEDTLQIANKKNFNFNFNNNTIKTLKGKEKIVNNFNFSTIKSKFNNLNLGIWNKNISIPYLELENNEITYNESSNKININSTLESQNLLSTASKAHIHEFIWTKFNLDGNWKTFESFLNTNTEGFWMEFNKNKSVNIPSKHGTITNINYKGFLYLYQHENFGIDCLYFNTNKLSNLIKYLNELGNGEEKNIIRFLEQIELNLSSDFKKQVLKSLVEQYNNKGIPNFKNIIKK